MAYVVPCIHPAALLQGHKPLPDTIRLDLAKALRVARYGFSTDEKYVIPLPANPIGIEKSTRYAIDWMDSWIRKKCYVAVDVETSSLDYFNCKLYTTALCGEDGNSTGVAFSLGDLHTIPWSAESALVNKFAELLAACPLVFHNAPFDCAVLQFRGFKLNEQIQDTLGLHHLVQPAIRHTLDWVAQTYLDVGPWKVDHRGEKQVFTKDIQELLLYNAKDAINTIKLRGKLLEEIDDLGMNSELVYWQSEFGKLATDMEMVGIPVNVAKRRAMGDALLARINQQKFQMREYLNWPDFNPMSGDHVRQALFSKKYCGLMPTALTEKTKVPATGYKNLLDYFDHPFVSVLINMIENQHVFAGQYRDWPRKPGDGKASKYTKAIRADGRLHPQWSAYRQKGARFTTQPNVQNQRKKDREFFEAPPGRVFVGADKSAVELRWLACAAGVPALVEEFAKPDGDAHILAAVAVYGKDFWNFSAEMRDQFRTAVKSVTYASLYRAGAETVWRTVRKAKWLPPTIRKALTLQEVKRIIKGYFGNFTQFEEYHDRIYAEACSTGFTEIPPFGRRRFWGVVPPPLNECANWGCQTSSCDYITKEMVEMKYELRKRFKDTWQIGHFHDQIVIETYERYAEEVKDLINKMFGNTVLEGPAGRVVLTAEASIGKTLKDVK